MKKLLFSITSNDCSWSYTKGSGPGGQKKNKTSSAVHCTHIKSGGRGYSEASRSQLDNKRDTFRKMYETKEFQTWLRLEISRRNGTLLEIEDYVNREMQKVRLEIKEDSKWVRIDKDKVLDDEN